jgi:glucokinase
MTGGGGATIGVDLGGTNVRVAIVAADGTIVADERRPRPAGLDDVISTIAALTAELEVTHGAAAAIGAGVAGLVTLGGEVDYAANIPGLIHAPFREALAKATGRVVAVDNDANVAALAELTYGAAIGTRHALVITIGTGVGGGVIVNGHVLRGASGFAGEIGHWQAVENGPRCACGQLGHWEAIASGTALGRMGRERAAWDAAPGLVARADGDIANITGEIVGAAALAGDADALGILNEFADNVALGFAGLANIFDPEVIAVSGGLVDLGDIFLEPVRAAFGVRLEGAEYRPKIPIVASKLGSEAGVIGAAVLARGA